ncbi:MAG TPA: DUF2840 domain-containing protein, partial [Rhodospirillales bacterium]|nr:DUF2840 domain-containing protein [Rhodospirillales bacterium]
HPFEVNHLDRRRAVHRFAEGALFAFIWWEADDFGTQAWAMAVCEALRPPADGYALPNIMPGVEVHLYARGRSQTRRSPSGEVRRIIGPVERALAVIDRLESDGFDPALVAPSYYRAAASRLQLRRPVRRLTRCEYEQRLRRAGR